MASRTKNLATAQEWEKHREEIVKLYIEKNYPLRVVMDKLAKKGFQPSASQYRSRFKIWRLKKVRKPESSKKGGEVVITAQQQAPTESESGSMRDEELPWQFLDFSSSTSGLLMVDEDEDSASHWQQQQHEDEMDRKWRADFFPTL